MESIYDVYCQIIEIGLYPDLLMFPYLLIICMKFPYLLIICMKLPYLLRIYIYFSFLLIINLKFPYWPVVWLIFANKFADNLCDISFFARAGVIRLIIDALAGALGLDSK